MKILILNWRDITHPQAGGAERYIHEIGKRLVGENEVTLICSQYPGAMEEEVIDGVRILRSGGRFSVYVRAALLYWSKRRNEQFDIILDDVNGVPFFSPLYADVPIIAIVHHVVGREIFKRELPFPFSAVGFLSERLIPMIYNDCRFVVVSESTRNEVVELGVDADKISIVQNGIELAPPNNPQKSITPSIIYLGRLKAYKRIDHTIRAFGIALKTIPNMELVIAGRGEQDDLKALAKELGIDKSIKFFGEVDETQKIESLSSAWLFVTTSIKEGWGISIIEANACGTPALSYDVPGLRDSISNDYNGRLVKDSDIEALAVAIVQIVSDRQLREKLGHNAVEWANRFGWDKSTCLLEGLMKDVLRDDPKEKTTSTSGWLS